MILKTIAEKRLKPCPFCGKKGKIDYLEKDNGEVKYFVYCEDNENCGCEITNPFVSVEDAVRAWNRGA